MGDYLIEIIFQGIDIDDSHQCDTLAEAGVVTAEPLDDRHTRVSAVIQHADVVDAAISFVERLHIALPGARAVRVDQDLVSVTDIAERVGVTREAVRHWTSGKRRGGRFPTPVGVPSGSKVWEWSAVHAWLRANLGIWDQLDLPTHSECALIDRALSLMMYPWRRDRATFNTLAWTRIDLGDATLATIQRARQATRPAPASTWSEPQDLPHHAELAANEMAA